MLWRKSRGRPTNAPAAFIHPCQPIVAKQPPSGPGWVHEVKHDGYRLQIHVKDGRVRLIQSTAQTGPSATPLIVRDAGRIESSAIVDAEVAWLDSDGMAVFDALHSRVYDAKASACAFDLLMLNGEDIHRRPYVERKAALRKILRHDKLLAAACKLGLEGIVSKKLDAPVQVRAVRGMAENQKSQCTGSHPRA